MRGQPLCNLSLTSAVTIHLKTRTRNKRPCQAGGLARTLLSTLEINDNARSGLHARSEWARHSMMLLCTAHRAHSSLLSSPSPPIPTPLVCCSRPDARATWRQRLSAPPQPRSPTPPEAQGCRDGGARPAPPLRTGRSLATAAIEIVARASLSGRPAEPRLIMPSRSCRAQMRRPSCGRQSRRSWRCRR